MNSTLTILKQLREVSKTSPLVNEMEQSLSSPLKDIPDQKVDTGSSRLMTLPDAAA